MLSFPRRCHCTAIAVMFFALSFLCGTAQAGTHIWTGPANGLWSNAANWSGGVPTTGEAGGTIVQFGANTTSSFDIAGLVIGQIHFTGTGNTISGTTALGIDGITSFINILDDAGGNALAASLPIDLSGATCLATINTGTLTIAGNISGNFSFSKNGPGTLVLSGNNSYTGFTSVIVGTLLVNGSQPGNAVNVFGGGNLGGTGTVGAVTVTAATLRPGASGAGTLSTGNLSLDATSVLFFDSSTSAPGETASLNVTGTVALNGCFVGFSFNSNNSFEAGSKLVLIANDGTDAISGTFSGFAEGAHFFLLGQIATLSYMDGTGNDVALTADTSPALAAPTSVTIGQNVNFSVAVNPSSAIASALSVAWIFGDGGKGTGTTVTHSYATPGIYHVQGNVTLGGTTLFNYITVFVHPLPLAGQTLDSDGDGFSDDIETAAGTDINSAASTPTGQPATAAAVTALTISKASIKLNFTGGGKDAISFSGTLNVPGGFNFTGAKVIIDAGGVAKSLTLTEKGSAVNGGDSVKIAKGKFTVSFKKGAFAAALADEGLTGGADVNPAAPRTVVFTLIFNNTILQKSQTLSYSAKKNKLGSASASGK